jgi:two-component system, NarL family, invasion response regulator UvrY
VRVCVVSPALDVSVQETTSPRDALIAFRKNRPDLVLLDLVSPNSSGLELLKRLLLGDKKTRILDFSMHAAPIYALHGAQGRGARLREQKRAGRGTAKPLCDEWRMEISTSSRRSPSIAQARYLTNDPFKELTTREIDIMTLLGEGKDLRTIAQQLSVTYKPSPTRALLSRENWASSAPPTYSV